MQSGRRKMDPDGKRAAVLEAGERLFSEHGYAGVTMAEIATSAAVAVGTLYRLFPDKAALLAALHERMEDRFIAVMIAKWHATEGYEARLRALVVALLEEAVLLAHLMPLYSLTRDLVGQVAYRPGERTVAAIEPLYAEGRAAGAFAAMDTNLAARSAYALVDAGMHSVLAAPKASRRRLIRQCGDLVARAFTESGAR